MIPEQNHLIYFSPTGTTKTLLKALAKGMGISRPRVTDITSPVVRKAPAPAFKNELVLVGAPVYAGRIPEQVADYLKQLKAEQTPVVLVVLYGNRGYEDALLELKTLTQEVGFTPLAAAAFIGEHSFSSADCPIAPGRPHAGDLKTAEEMGGRVRAVLNIAETVDQIREVAVPGNHPFREGLGTLPITGIVVSDECSECGVCLSVCPMEAIDAANGFAAVAGACTMCCACIKSCPQGARSMAQGPFMEKAQLMSKNCAVPKTPEIFLPRSGV